jgi:hypothetical protein
MAAPDRGHDVGAYPKPDEGRVAGMQCYLTGCIFNDGDRTIAFVYEARAFPEDCRTADILIVRFSAPRDCTGPSVVVDRRALIQHGAHAVSWDAGVPTSDIFVRNSQPATGSRLWLGSVPHQ